MSQASRSRILAAQRHRRGLARVIAMSTQRRLRESTLSRQAALDGRTEIILDGVGFDVHRAREYSEELKSLEVEQAVFEDWTRERGKGPENREPCAFDGPRCGLCDRRRFGSCLYADCAAPATESYPPRGGWPGKLAREWPGDRRAPMGRSLARLGRRLLEALKGQPSECQACGDDCDVVTHDGDEVCDCLDCQGTGHNLAGVLPPTEWSPAVRRKVSDSHEGSLDDVTRSQMRQWVDDIGVGIFEHPGLTRVVPRGEHRSDLEPGAVSWLPRGSPRVWAYAPQGEAEHLRPRHLAPRWRRGELRHAQQRRERDGLDELDAQAYDEFMAEVDDRGHWSPREAAE